MAVELAQAVVMSNHMQRLNRRGNTLVHLEERPKRSNPLPVISSEGYPGESSRIGRVNFFLAGAYGVSLAYDELCKKVLDTSKKSTGKKRKGPPYTISDFVRELNEVNEYSVALSRVLSGYMEDTPQAQEAESLVAEKTKKIFERTFQAPSPPQQEKQIDTQLGIERFLLSEVLGMHTETHDIRTPLTTFKISAQMLQRKNKEEFSEEFIAIVKQRQEFGDLMRKRLLFPLPVHAQSASEILEKLQKFVKGEALQQEFRNWNIILPEAVPPGFPQVVFNEQILFSIVENAFMNARKGRELLEEHFSQLLVTLFLGSESARMKYRALRSLQRIDDRLEQLPTILMDFGQVTLRRKPYTEIVFRDNGIGNDYNSGRRQWRKNFSIGDSDWSGSHAISGTGIAMGTHRQRIKQLFPHSYADIFLRNRSDNAQGAELVIRLPVEQIAGL